MESALPLPVKGDRARRWRLEALFTSQWLALSIPLLVPLVILFW